MNSMTTPVSDADLLLLVKAGATITADQYAAGREGGLKAMLVAGFVFHAHYLDKLPTDAARRLGF